MVNYAVKYRMANQWFWRTIRNVKGDWVPNDLPVPTRVLILDDESRVEIPMTGTLFMFDHNRFLHIKQQMEREAGQKINT